MVEADFWHTTLHSFNLRLKGWREQKDADSLERWQIGRRIAHYAIPGGNWKQYPDLMREWPLSSDPKPEDLLITISDEEMARRKYKIKKVYGSSFDEEFEALIRTHYQPDWGPHPDELVQQPKTDASPA